MAFIALPGGIRVALEFTLADKVVVNIYHVTTTDPIISVKLAAVAQLFANWWDFDESPQFSSNIGLVKVVAHDISVTNGEKHEEIISPPIQGGIASIAASNNVALVGSLLTVKTGRSFQGRTYLAGLNLTAMSNNTVDTSRLVALTANFVDLMADLAAANSALVVASFESGGIPRALGVATPVTGVAFKSRVDTQRRRLPRE